ncbi:hypothetical protein RIF29_36351 [Crotalaria pallida]|uniref:Transmembrane protein n=1 Tax=Crotalaria pallida TaxID=3830 RepID=A0AAN9HUA5_CROPI
MMRVTASELIIHPLLWRLMGFVSSIVGFTCYAMSPSFQDLFGKPNPFKMVIYSVVSSVISILMLFVQNCRWGVLKSFLMKAHVGFLILTLTSLYSYLEDRSSEEGKVENGFGRVMNLTSTGAFALMAMSLSRQLQLGFEVGIFNFLIGCFLVTVMKMNFKLAPLAALFCYLLVNIRSFSDVLLEMRGHGSKKEHVDEEIVEIHQDSNRSLDLEQQRYQETDSSFDLEQQHYQERDSLEDLQQLYFDERSNSDGYGILLDDDEPF